MTGYRRYLLSALYAVLSIGVLLLFFETRPVGTFLVVVSVLGVVAVSVTGREDE
ncbi:hypothetical protein [Actinospica robiniae]|uniref:hypothetical protein n=1 Tax=Actinospica robiniae TaxID=304901 RepID=UPI0004152829|nr:hypothetical protein [Actinospica robiniae]